jgi:hypothetical protein
MKTITTHHDGFGLNDLIEIRASDEDVNGVPHRIDFYRHLTDEELAQTTLPSTLVHCGFLAFQHGPRNVIGSTPGLISDAVYAALIHIMEGFQAGPFKSREGAIVLTKLEEAALWSHKRARDRAARGVLGHNKA